MWVYGIILIFLIEMVRDLNNYTKQNFNTYIHDLIFTLTLIFGPILLFIVAKDYAKIDLEQAQNIDGKPKWIIALAIFIGCIALIATAFLAKTK